VDSTSGWHGRRKEEKSKIEENKMNDDNGLQPCLPCFSFIAADLFVGDVTRDLGAGPNVNPGWDWIPKAGVQQKMPRLVDLLLEARNSTTGDGMDR
jgi:hypothetical protein